MKLPGVRFRAKYSEVVLVVFLSALAADGLRADAAALTVSQVKGTCNGTAINVEGAAVTAAWPNAFYIEADNRSSGIRVDYFGQNVATGWRVSVSGVTTTTPNGEKAIAAQSVVPVGMGRIEPLVVRNDCLGGESLTFPWLSSPAQKGVLGSIGLNNIGMLVTASGVVHAPRTPSGWFYIDDGSGASDGSDIPGIYVEAPGLIAPAAGQLAVVTGISSCEWYNGNLVNVLRPRGQYDINPVPPDVDDPPPPPFLTLANPRGR